MKQSKYSEAQIMGILNQAEGGVPAVDNCREHVMSTASCYKWRAKYGGVPEDRRCSGESTWRGKHRGPMPLKNM